MKLPFIQHTAIGIHITRHKVRWIELSRVRDHVWIKNKDSELVDGDFEAALENLLKRQEKYRLSVSVNIDASLVHKKLVTVPDVDEEDIVNAWIDKQYSLMAEEGANSDSYLMCHTILDSEHGDRKCFFAAVKRDEIEKLEMRLRSKGLEPVMMTTGTLETSYGLILSPEFVEEQSCIVRLFEDESFVGQYKGGLLQSISPLDASKMSQTDILDELDLIFSSGQNFGHENKPISVYLMLSQELRELTDITEKQTGRKQGLQLLSVDDHFNLSGKNFPGDFSIAIGLAMKLLYPALDQINFLDKKYLWNTNREIEKRDSIHISVGAGGFLLILFLLVMSIQWYVSAQLDQVQQTASQMEDKITAIESATEILLVEREQIKQVQNLIRNRSDLAPALQKIGKLTPDDVWLRELTVQNMRGVNRMNMHGFAASEAGVSKFIEMVERNTGVKNVALINAERMQSDRFYSKEEFSPRFLIRFEMQLEVENRD